MKGKPFPDIFLKASEKLGIHYSECIGVEDAVSGIEAIKRANMFAIGIGNKSILREADVIYSETKDIDLKSIKLLVGITK